LALRIGTGDRRCRDRGRHRDRGQRVDARSDAAGEPERDAGKSPKLSPRQRVHILKLFEAGEHTIAELAELFSVSRATVYREVVRARHGCI